MRHVIIALISIFCLSCSQEPEAHFGEEINSSGSVDGKTLIAMLQENDQTGVKVTGEIVTTCKMKGCWMTMDLGEGQEMRVTFKDYAFFVPKEGVEGKKVIVEGVAKKSITDVETLKHFAEDAGKSEQEIAAITQPEEELTFEATGVIIKGIQE